MVVCVYVCMIYEYCQCLVVSIIGSVDLFTFKIFSMAIKKIARLLECSMLVCMCVYMYEYIVAPICLLTCMCVC